jgi:hypothetical protein
MTGSGLFLVADSLRTFRGAGADSVEARSRISRAGYIGLVEALDTHGQKLSGSAMVDGGG